MIPEWPSVLTRFERAGWQTQLQDARRRSQPEAGPPRFRRRSSSVARMVGLTLITSRDEKAVFDAFYEDACKQGSLIFTMPDPATDGWQLLASDGHPLLVSPSGTPLLMSARWLCAWGDQPPLWAMDGDVEFRNEFQVWVLP